MQYRQMKNTDEEVSILGFGCMRFPIINGDEKKIDVQKSEEMLDYAIDHGVNYLDTAWPYHQEASEVFVGNYLEKRDLRDDVHLATKLPSWLIKKREDMDLYLNKQLKRLKTDYIDFYLIHSLNAKSWKNLKDNGIFDFMKDVKEKGIVKHIGFSFHDQLPVFKKIVDDYDAWEFTQIQLNYLDEEEQAGLEGMHYARDKGLGIIVMEPLRGGNIVGEIPNDIAEIWDEAEKKKPYPEWALKYLWDKPEVDLVLSGMSHIDHVKGNVKYAEDSHVNCLDNQERGLIQRVKEKYLEKIEVPCTNCKYCMPCPYGVNIPRAFRGLNEAKLFESVEASKKEYLNAVGEDHLASKCTECNVCVEKCPQNINIPVELKKIINMFEV